MSEERSPTAWPKDWRDGPDSNRFHELYFRLEAQYGQERTAKIIAGEDEATNEDLQRWRFVGGQ